MSDNVAPVSPVAQGWLDFVHGRQALVAANPALRDHVEQEFAVIQPTLRALGLNADIPNAKPIPALQEPSKNTQTFPPPVSVKLSVAPPANDGQGHPVGKIVATDPNKYDKDIRDACEYYGKLYGVKLDPNLVKAHIWQESKGDPWAMSQDGQNSRGLMQVSNSAGVPTATILSKIKNPDGSTDPNIPEGGGDQYDPRTSIFTGVKYEALAMSGKMGEMLRKSGISPTELGVFPDRPLSQTDAMRAYQGGPGVLTNPTRASDIYAAQLTGLQSQFAAGKAPSDPGYTNPAGGPGWKEPTYGSIV